MIKKPKRVLLTVVLLAITGLTVWYIRAHNVRVLEPAGPVGQKERGLIVFTVWLAAIVVIPVFALTFFIVRKYRVGNKNAKYSPSFDHHPLIELVWWAIPGAIILTLSIVTWQSSHALDPYKALASKAKPLTVEVVSMDWKWLFIYPDQHIASVNFMEVPEHTPINLHITSDSVMNSFWVPQLGGQIYAMPGMSTQLHLMADKPGNYYGSPANITGQGFAGMTFDVKAVSTDNFHAWVDKTAHAPRQLTMSVYNSMARPSTYNPTVYYSNVKPGLYYTIIMKYMAPTSSGGNTKTYKMEGM